MDKTYNHKNHEGKIYELWEKKKAFTPEIQKGKKPFTIILPPPNANAPLHLGHAMYVVEDILIRWHRMMGDPALWVPGADHAGFETQVVYEKHLEKMGKSRFDFERETLYKDIWEFVQNNKATMENQLRKLGFSLDWTRKKFTLDSDVVATTQATFKKLYDDGLIYRENRLVNYCTKHQTAFSDLEVEHVEKEETLYFVKFPVEGEKPLVVATVRPETIPGDAAVAVHPTDKRYKNYIGKSATNPVNGNTLPIIADEFVDKKFGTGAVKITPAHDESDFEVAKRHNLPLIQVIDLTGRLNENADIYKGLKVTPAREKIVEYLRQKNLLEKTEPYSHTVSTCYKCGNILEPLPIPQWYVKTKPLAQKAIDVIKKGKIKIIPKRFEKTYFQWLENIRDWNISRQIVWGIRIPAWECQGCKEWTITDGATPQKCKSCSSTNLVQDQDNFDTWFSSGQWPFAALGYPESSDYKYFYPTSVMETGYDILFFWVARMVMLGLYVTGKTPFEVVYLHGLVRDPKGQKMSKSKGNVINPMDIVEKYGADALRMALVAGTGAGNDQNFSESKIVGYRNFANKVWNIARFVELAIVGAHVGGSAQSAHTANENWIREELDKTIKKVNSALENYRFNEAAEEVYEFIWHKFADIYIERVKNRRIEAQKTLEFVLKESLKLLHPFMPFVTEAIWSFGFAQDKEDLLATSSWPKI